MISSVQRQEQLEINLENFKEIAHQQISEKINKWFYHFPATISLILFVCQIANTIIFFYFAYNFEQLNILINNYISETNTKKFIQSNFTKINQYKDVNEERLIKIDNYHDELWSMFVTEVILLIFPCINLLMFVWVIQNKKRYLPTRVQIIYILCPVLALLLCICQACMIHVTLTKSIYKIRFFLTKLLEILLKINKPGCKQIENYFDCEFFNDNDINKPLCTDQLHDTVMSSSTLSIIIAIHILPFIVFLYMLIKNLKSNKTEHLFLYIETINIPTILKNEVMTSDTLILKNEHQTFKETILKMLHYFNIHFLPNRIFQAQLAKYKFSTKKNINLNGTIQKTNNIKINNNKDYHNKFKKQKPETSV